MLKKTGYYVRHNNEQRKSMHRGHFHESYEIVLIIKGTRKFFVGHQSYTLDKRKMLLLKPNTIHRALTSSEDFEGYLIMIPASMVQTIQVIRQRSLFECFEKESPILTLDQNQYENIFSIITNLYEEQKTKNSDMQLTALLNATLLIYINRFQMENGDDPKYNEERELTRNTIQYLFAHYDEDLSLDKLAQKEFVTVHHLCKYFKKDTGFTIMDYLNCIRIRESVNLMENETLTITDICYRVGYNSPNHFIRNFKKRMNITPKQYQQRLLQRKEESLR